MLTASFRHKTVLILLVTLLTASALPATVLTPEFSRSLRPDDLSEAFHEFLRSFWNFLQKLQGTKEGCRIDPDGCASQNPQPQPKEGCRIDPNGRCLP